MKKKLLALFVVLAMVLAMVPAVNAQATFALKITPSVATAQVGDTVEYTIYATGEGITGLQFNLVIPAGLKFVTDSGVVPSGLKAAMGWGAMDWTEKTETDTPMLWSGYTDAPSTFAENTVVMTFSCTVEAEGEYEIGVFELLPFDADYNDFPADLSVGKLTVAAAEETEPSTEPTTEPTTVTEPEPEGTFMIVDVKADATEVNVGDTVNFTVYGYGDGITGLQFNIGVPAGMTFVTDSGVVPSGLKEAMGWGAMDWTEKTETDTPMLWSGYTDAPSTFQKDTILMTFSCTADAAGEYVLNIYELLPFDAEYNDFPATLNVDTVTVVAGAVCEHSFTNYKSNNDATCTADGTETAKCDKCDATDTRTVAGSALGHAFGEYVPNNDATCTADGTKTASCSRCDATDKVADEGSATGHSFNVYKSNNDATCTADGTETAKCDNCDATDSRVAAGSAKGHKLNKVEATVTCTEAGNIAHYVCETCGEMFADATGSIPTNEDAIKADALGHVDENDDKVCDRCGYTEGAPAAKEYCLVGYINGADYGCNDDWQNVGEYIFVDGTLTATFNVDSYIFVKTTDNANWYLTESYCTDTTGKFVTGASEKMLVPGNVELTFTLVENEDGSVTVSYAVTQRPSEPTEPSTEPTEPSTEPTEPSTEPTEPSTEPTEPSTEPTEPSTEPTEPSTEATEPSTEATEPTTEATEPSTEATEPTTTKPGTTDEENPKTDNNGLVLYFAVMMVAAFAVLFAVLLGKKKYMA